MKGLSLWWIRISLFIICLLFATVGQKTKTATPAAKPLTSSAATSAAAGVKTSTPTPKTTTTSSSTSSSVVTKPSVATKKKLDKVDPSAVIAQFFDIIYLTLTAALSLKV